MRRTIERLAADRLAKEEALRAKLAELQELGQTLDRIQRRLDDPSPSSSKPRPFGRPSAARPDEVRTALAETVGAVKALAAAAAGLAADQDALSDARDREWDALGNNHVGMIFKSMEWRVDRLAAASEDVASLMKTFILLKDQLGRLREAVEEKRLPTPALVGEVLEPLEDWSYLRFENRFRGAQSEIRRTQAEYLAVFPKGGRILDLGCGRGEFLELLARNGFIGHGVDLNAEMVAACRDKGLSAERGDLLEVLAGREDASLEGIFSAQVVEHLPPSSLRRLVDLIYAKLAPGGTVVLETVNPASVFALVQIYLLDLTHRTPVHPRALAFLLEAAGFAGVEIRPSGELAEERLRPLPGTDATTAALNANFDRLNELLFAAPNYAAVGQKN